MPPDIEYGDNEHILKADLWKHFQQLLETIHKEGNEADFRVKHSHGVTHDVKAAYNYKRAAQFEIADITFAKE